MAEKTKAELADELAAAETRIAELEAKLANAQNGGSEEMDRLTVVCADLTGKCESLEKRLAAAQAQSRVSARALSSGLSEEDMKDVADRVRVGLSEEDAIEVVLAQKAADEANKKAADEAKKAKQK